MFLRLLTALLVTLVAVAAVLWFTARDRPSSPAEAHGDFASRLQPSASVIDEAKARERLRGIGGGKELPPVDLGAR
jgi:hypothetical protein